MRKMGGHGKRQYGLPQLGMEVTKPRGRWSVPLGRWRDWGQGEVAQPRGQGVTPTGR